MNKRGFTLMEVLAVVLILAVVASLAIPGVRAARFETRHSQAKAAAKQLITGINNYRVSSRGGEVAAGCFSGGSAYFDQVCNSGVGGNTGIPSQTAQIPLTQLAPCGFLVAKEFRELPYTFCYKTDVEGSWAGIKGVIEGQTGKKAPVGDVVLIAVGLNSKAGKYYSPTKKEYAIYIDDQLIPKEYEK